MKLARSVGNHHLATVLFLPTGLAHPVLYGSCWFARCCIARSECSEPKAESPGSTLSAGSVYLSWQAEKQLYISSQPPETQKWRTGDVLIANGNLVTD